MVKSISFKSICRILILILILILMIAQSCSVISSLWTYCKRSGKVCACATGVHAILVTYIACDV